MLDSLHAISLSNTKHILKGVNFIVDWAILYSPERASFFQEVKRNSLWVKDWIKPVDASKKIGSLQKTVSKMQQNHSWKVFKVLDRGNSCARAGLATVLLVDKYKFSVFSAVTTLLCKRVSLVLALVGDIVSVARKTHRVFKIYSQKNATQEALKKSCVSLGMSVYSLSRSLLCAGVGFSI